MCGSYADMDAGNISEALMDFTGGPHVAIKLSEASDKLWDTMRRASQSEYLMGCGTPGGVIYILILACYKAIKKNNALLLLSCDLPATVMITLSPKTTLFLLASRSDTK